MSVEEREGAAAGPVDDEGAAGTGGFRSALYMFVLLFLTWILLTFSLDWQELAAGAVVSLVITLFFEGSYRAIGLPTLSPRRLWYMLVYVVVLGWAIIKANLDVAIRILNPKLPIRPGIVVIRTGLTSSMAKLVLANSITLTPGTFTLDVIGDRLLIHWIDVRAEGLEEATGIISGTFERYLKEIFE